MSDVKHTPGPWSVDDYGAGQRIVVKGRRGYSGDYRVADAHFSSELIDCARVPEMQANAHLIAAAPDLLAACKEFVRKVEAGEAKSVRSYKEMCAAIAKVEGGAA